MCFGVYRHYFASGAAEGVAQLWCSSRSFAVRLLVHGGPASLDVPLVAFHPNASLLVTAASDGVARLFDLRTADCVRVWSSALLRGGGLSATSDAGRAGNATGTAADANLPRLQKADLLAEPSALAVSPNGRLVAVASEWKQGRERRWGSQPLLGKRRSLPFQRQEGRFLRACVCVCLCW